MSNALDSFLVAIGHAERLMTGVKDGRGRPNEKEVSMFVAATVLTYAAWEGYVEDVAVEVTVHLAQNTPADRVPDSVRKNIEQSEPSAWDLSIHPGFRGLWLKQVELYAKGTEDDKPPFGMNTANPKNVIELFENVGLKGWLNVSQDDKDGIAKLVELRGGVAHTAGTPEDFKKGVAREHLDRVKRVVSIMDESLATQTKDLTGQRPW